MVQVIKLERSQTFYKIFLSEQRFLAKFYVAVVSQI